MKKYTPVSSLLSWTIIRYVPTVSPKVPSEIFSFSCPHNLLINTFAGCLSFPPSLIPSWCFLGSPLRELCLPKSVLWCHFGMEHQMKWGLNSSWNLPQTGQDSIRIFSYMVAESERRGRKLQIRKKLKIIRMIESRGQIPHPLQDFLDRVLKSHIPGLSVRTIPQITRNCSYCDHYTFSFLQK